MHESMNPEPDNPKTDHPPYVVVGKISPFDPEFVHEIFFFVTKKGCEVYIYIPNKLKEETK